jgi:microcystin-dependent protein
MWPTEYAPKGWLSCDGRGIPSRDPLHGAPAAGYEEYENLYNILKKTGELKWISSQYFDIKDGSKKWGNFVKLPDLRQRFPLGAEKDTSWTCGQQSYDTTIGHKGGTNSHTLTIEEMPSHTHSIPSAYYADNNANHGYLYEIDPREVCISTVQSNQTGDGKAHNNIPPYFAINFIIKYQ